MNDPIRTAEDYNLEHPAHPPEPAPGDLYVSVLIAAIYSAIILAFLYLALES